MVQKDAKKLDSTKETMEYNKQLEVVLGHVLMSEYLDLLEVVNNDLQFIQSVITNEINADFEQYFKICIFYILKWETPN